MKPLHVKKIAVLLSVALLGTVAVLQANINPAVQCQESKKEYVNMEAQWSSLYTEESFLHDELNRLQNISRDVKIIIDILNMASEMIETNGKLSKTETATLNIRIPKDRGILYSDGSFAITGHEAKPLKESQKILDNIAVWSNKGVIQVQGNISYIHPQISQLHRKVNTLEAKIATICTDEMVVETLEKEYTTANDQAIIDRFAQRERQRYDEVSNRRWGEIERSWVNRYYNTCRFRPCRPGIGRLY